jgi:hypothetical protein
MTHAWNFKKVMTSYLSQSVDRHETPHLPGRPEMAPKLRLLMVMVRLLMHRRTTSWSARAHRAIESEDAVTAPRGQVALPVMYERHGTRFEPTCSHVIAAEAFDTSSAGNKATTRTYLFVRDAIAHSFSKAL